MVVFNADIVDAFAHATDNCVDAVVTSPPYVDMRPEYGTPTEWLPIFKELHRVVDGPMVWNVGRKWVEGIEQMWWLALLTAAAEAGWEHWDTLIWFKPNANPIQGHVATNSHEYLLCFGKPGVRFREESRLRPYAEGSEARLKRRWVSSVSVKGDGPERNGPRRSERQERRDANPDGARAPSLLVHTTGKEKGIKHPAPMALDLALELVEFVAAPGQIVLDPFAGSGTTGLAARKLGRRAVLVELSEEYCAVIAERTQQLSLLT